MIKIAFLASRDTLPGNANRRDDAHEHDLEVAEIRPALLSIGYELVPVAWDDSSINWTDYAAVMIGTTWDYWDRYEEFFDTLHLIEMVGTPLYNPTSLVRWNSQKTYLKDLETKGIRTIPTLWLDKPDARELKNAFGILGSDDLVVKRQVGAGAHGQQRIHKGDDLQDYPYAAMVQPFLSTIQSEGEYSFVLIDGELSHALLKTAKSGDYRIQSLYGGTEARIEPSEADLQSAKRVVSVLDETPLYARVDMVRDLDGQLRLMELELIEPYLYPEQSDQLGIVIARALKARIG